MSGDSESSKSGDSGGAQDECVESGVRVKGGGEGFGNNVLEGTTHLQCFAPRLFIGDIEAAVDPVLLGAANVTHLIDLSNSFVDDHHPRDPSTGLLLKNAHYEVQREVGEWREACPMVAAKLVVRVDDVDGAPLADHFDAINAFIASALGASERGAVLIHCFRGKSRSATACVQYLMQKQQQQQQQTRDSQQQTHGGLRLKQAMEAVKRARPVIDVNVTFKKELMDLERRLWPNEPPSVVLKLTSRKPVLSSSSSVLKRGKVAGGGGSGGRARFASTSPVRHSPPPAGSKQESGPSPRPLRAPVRRAITLDSTI
jgi:hypothetical protein